LGAQAVITDATGAPVSGYIEEQDNGSLTAMIDGAGLTYDLQSVDTITVSDVTTYNLNTISSAAATLGELELLLENLADERSLAGANLSRLEKEIDNLNGKITQGELAVSRIEDTDVALESNRFATRQVRMQSSIAILAQAQKLNIGIQDLIRGIMIGQS
jgi:flagellin